ncbi:hypothetical protein UMZ34_24720 [Halopseudomonas pachastrellae]|nr:hypothetical protein UMZ34_24720 [Halopseudomonas pachastrellae]
MLCLPLHDANQQLAGLLLLARHQGDIADALSEPLSIWAASVWAG